MTQSTVSRTAFAVFEVLPADTPVKWTAKGRVFVEDSAKPGLMIGGVVLPDQSIAVLRTRYGEALEHLAQKDATDLEGGRVLSIEAADWPTADECFAAIVADFEEHQMADAAVPSC